MVFKNIKHYTKQYLTEVQYLKTTKYKYGFLNIKTRN